jgi:hypothetical protein
MNKKSDTYCYFDNRYFIYRERNKGEKRRGDTGENRGERHRKRKGGKKTERQDKKNH